MTFFCSLLFWAELTLKRFRFLMHFNSTLVLCLNLWHFKMQFTVSTDKGLKVSRTQGLESPESRVRDCVRNYYALPVTRKLQQSNAKNLLFFGAMWHWHCPWAGQSPKPSFVHVSLVLLSSHSYSQCPVLTTFCLFVCLFVGLPGSFSLSGLL